MGNTFGNMIAYGIVKVHMCVETRSHDAMIEINDSIIEVKTAWENKAASYVPTSIRSHQRRAQPIVHRRANRTKSATAYRPRM